MGSSLGGLISHYIGIKHQDIFSKVGIFSPSYWFNDSVYDFTFISGKHEDIKFYIMGGTDEGSGLVDEMMAMVDTLQAAGFGEEEMALKVVQGGQHNEQLWREQFAEAYEWLFFEDPYNISSVPAKQSNLLFYQNGYLNFSPSAETQYQGSFSIKLFSITGQQVLNVKNTTHSPIELPTGLHGVFIARIVGDSFAGSQKIFIPGR
jgi:hypothetical protein